ncbi:hypothetical protein [Aureimonas sp. SA4125]|uniref:hypothetical protein n=1 Tax=Aureimonas sp. SA4125 TaxID=2826993 RepID=UPI001CC39F0B|nr:hypothetical protein [Aureimonas sp. SA4125]
MSNISTTESIISPESRSLGYVAGAALLVFPIATPIIAMIDRKEASPLLQSHYLYQAGTFWKSLILAIVLTLAWLVTMAAMFVIPPLALLSPVLAIGAVALSVWYVARAIKSLVYLSRGKILSKPGTWAV